MLDFERSIWNERSSLLYLHFVFCSNNSCGFYRIGFKTIVCSPNEDFGRLNKRSDRSFRCTFQWPNKRLDRSFRCTFQWLVCLNLVLKPVNRPRNPRIPIARFDIQTAFRARMSIFNHNPSKTDVRPPNRNKMNVFFGGSSFNDGTTQTALDPPGGGGGSHTK
jgi:hypothetical protein